MSNDSVSRREALKLGVALTSVAVVGTSVSAAAKEPVVGVSTLGFRNHTNEELAEEFEAHGVTMTQFFFTQKDTPYWRFNGRSDLPGLTMAKCEQIAEGYRSHGVAIHSIGVYTNLLHPDPAERAANLAYFEAMMEVGEAMGVRTFVNEAGHYEPAEKKSSMPYCLQAAAWEDMVAAGKQLADLAEKYDATILLEPVFGGFMASAKRTRQYVEAVDSPRTRVLLDPANLLEVNDLGEMFEQLHPWIDCLHAKDRKLHTDHGVAAGQGDIDYDEFVDLAARYAPEAPIILEYVKEDDYLDALAIVQAAIERRKTG